ncbi:SARP family transcriptional regulator [Amycolatopsis mediterranei S699]|uniref:SARP family transcriptional regulator n=2 Tax=Amycolatopsis mediterranei TaxID=33910 RepID=A0A0H3DCQ0_AMYMU|nr:BTAD domain-containing putative transcriptional regulator [Amycolatopsis mediterranei]ADJ48486.1 SARP family transcriptional regulator [Amycolatopsis mediterranei U32]AEK45410.1 SARP family transcriptional regulator [Amycolatopsis mediterranei S699]AFO80197.1 SARP family transcriptional regulator [Amycolatopsis mediterranei S699]AGT87325.1 SARP family transcriptional regulator [Amycolatopsis mediterranei RB]KDO11004.1 SARP family transcriptional regulator [Amycolatopsis mediterranei]
MEFPILGPLAVSRAVGRRAALGGRKPRTLLAALLSARGRVVLDERLISLLRADERQSTVDVQVCAYVSRLRKALGRPARLVRAGGGYLLTPGGTVEAEELSRLAYSGDGELRADRPARAGELFRAVLALWRGPVLDAVAEPLRAGEAARFDELRLAVLEDRIEAEIAPGDHLRAVHDVTAFVLELRMRERAQALLVAALCAGGGAADAVAVYHRGRRLLDERVGGAPGPRCGRRTSGCWTLRRGRELAGSPDQVRRASAAASTGAASAPDRAAERG